MELKLKKKVRGKKVGVKEAKVPSLGDCRSESERFTTAHTAYKAANVSEGVPLRPMEEVVPVNTV